MWEMPLRRIYQESGCSLNESKIYQLPPAATWTCGLLPALELEMENVKCGVKLIKPLGSP